jgi:3-deoxy-manno-octulosonate cytidylyltransferase (CMP-KDO synthetase)
MGGRRSDPMRVVAIIPVRYQSTRLEGKPLADIHGKPMVQHVYEHAMRSSLMERVIVATDDARIKEAVEKFGGQVVLTSKGHPTGTDRIAEVAGNLDVQVVVNIQGDELFVKPGMLDSVVHPLLEDRHIPMGTLMCELDREAFDNPNVVKVVTDREGFALYFSRSLIPYPNRQQGYRAFEHIGIYSYQKDFLLTYPKLERTPLEKSESLEQLRALEHGFKIKVVPVENYVRFSVNTQEDLKRARAFARELEGFGEE